MKPPPLLDAIPRLGDRIQRLGFHPFRVCGVVAMVTAMAVLAVLGSRLGLHLGLRLMLAAAALASFFALAWLTKVITGVERLVYWRHHLVATAACAALLAILGQPIWPALDVLTLSVGAFLVVGRFGCTLVGCCHGWPHRHGVRYGKAHAEEGFPWYYVGIPLFPIQLIEALWVLLLVGAAAWLALSPVPDLHGCAGAPTLLYIIGYASGRHLLEYGRGDPGRPFLAGFSEAQWTSLLLLAAAAALGAAGLVPLAPLAVGAAVLIGLSMLGVALARYGRVALGDLPLSPPQVRELAEALAIVVGERPGEDLHVAVTSDGVRLSSSRPAGDAVHHYAISRERGSFGEPAARRIARLILMWRHPRCRSELRAGGRRVYHLLVTHRSPERGAMS